MSYRLNRKYVKRSKTRFFTTIIIIIVLLYLTITWFLPNFITGLGLISGEFKPKKDQVKSPTEQAIIAPPTLSIPFEATNSSEIEIKGYSSSGSKVKIFLDDNEQETVQAISDGSFSSRLKLTFGTNNIYAQSIDENNESLPSKIVKVVFDRDRPSLQIFEPEDNKIITGEKKVKVSGKTEVDINVLINDNRIILDNEGKFNTEILLNDGENIITIKAQDKATNTTEVIRKVTFQP